MTAHNEETAQTPDRALPVPDCSPPPDHGPLLQPATAPPTANTSRRALLVMAKQPIAGSAKTRLVPPLTSTSAASLYLCFLQDVLATVRAAARLEPFDPVIAYTPPAAQDFFRQLAPDFWLIPQQSPARTSNLDPPSEPTAASPASRPAAAPPSQSGAAPQHETLVHHPDPLGDRLQFVLSAALDSGRRQVVAINSDSPTLQPELLCTAFQRLDDPRTDAVFGPCTDGGYYLIGVKKPPGRLVTAVQMSTPTVLSDTLAIAAAAGLQVDLLPEWYDVDSAEDLERLSTELAAHPERAPASSRFLTEPWTSTSSSQP